MRYGYFDDLAREYVVTRPDTPAPWANYLGSPAYGAIITQNAGGYSFARSGAKGRILRYHFNQDDTPGRYIYLRDHADGTYWSQTWQPCGRDLAEFKTVCRHGLGYTRFETRFRDISSHAIYYVPPGGQYEIWSLSLKNESGASRKISVFGFVEFTTDGDYEQDGINLQYTQFITKTRFSGNSVFESINENCHGSVNGSRAKQRSFSLAGAEAAGYCGDKAAFLGAYRGYGNPIAVERGDCGNITGDGGNPCAALQADIALEPGEVRRICFILAETSVSETEGLVRKYGAHEAIRFDLDALHGYWKEKLSGLHVETPDPVFNSMVNIWNAYQCFITFTWSRAASLFYCGLRNGYGYRDTVQDIGGIVHLDPQMAKEKLVFMLGAQMSHGGGLPLVKFDHKAGAETGPEDENYVRETAHPSYRADDALWLFPAVYKYVSEAGDDAFLSKQVPYANEGAGTVFEHLQRAIAFTQAHPGLHGLPAGLHADWNDCLRLGETGVSSFVAFQLYYALGIMAELAGCLSGMDGYMQKLAEDRAGLAKLIEENFWDGDRFIRGISADGLAIGTRENSEASFWLNPQTWALLSGYAVGERADRLLDAVHEKLNTAYGAELMTPSFRSHPFPGAYAILFNAGMKENAGVFLQPQGWLILAEALRGHGDRAYEYYAESCPAAQNDRAEIRCAEPYVYSQFTEGRDALHHGRSHVHWLTGTASTVMAACVEGILGIRPTPAGLRLSPALPAQWREVKIRKQWRGKTLHIMIVTDGDGEDNRVVLNGKTIMGDLIPFDALDDVNEILVRI